MKEDWIIDDFETIGKELAEAEKDKDNAENADS